MYVSVMNKENPVGCQKETAGQLRTNMSIQLNVPYTFSIRVSIIGQHGVLLYGHLFSTCHFGTCANINIYN